MYLCTICAACGLFYCSLVLKHGLIYPFVEEFCTSWLCCATFMTVLCYLHDCAVLPAWLCCATCMTVLCYLHDCAVLPSWRCCATFMSVLCYLHDCAVLPSWLCCATFMTVLCYLQDNLSDVSVADPHSFFSNPDLDPA